MDWVQRALDGEPVCDVGQMTKAQRRKLARLNKAGKLDKYPHPLWPRHWIYQCGPWNKEEDQQS